MLTEDDLRELIDSAAGDAPEPSPLPDDLFAFDAPRTQRRSPRSLAPFAAVAALILVILLGASLLGGGAKQKTSAVSAPARTAAGSGARPPDAEAPATTVPIENQIALGAAAGGGAVGASSTATPAPPVDSARIVKNGSLEIRVGRGTVAASVNRVAALAAGLGGYVSDTRTTSSEQSGSQASATITVRVPAASFEQLMSDASSLGDVRATTTSGQDVTAQFTDIEAQLTALNATRDQLLLVQGEANNVGDILAVQDRITQVQTQIDQLEGQKRLLTDQSAFGTLSVTLLEPGATAAVPAVDDNKDLGDAWSDARANFVDGIEWIVSVSGTLAFLALVGGVLLGGWTVVYRRLRRETI